jgi:hypothetical protein
MPTKPLAVPSDHGIGLHDDQGGAPVPPALGEENPEQSVRRAELRTFPRARQRGHLLTECEILKRDRPVSAADQSERSEEYKERRQHVVILSCLATTKSTGGTSDLVLANDRTRGMTMGVES